MPPANAPADYRYCPYCGTALQPRVLREGSPPRAWCDACGFVAYAFVKLLGADVIGDNRAKTPKANRKTRRLVARGDQP